MDPGEREFQQRLLRTFVEEAGEHVDAIAAGLVKLGGGADDPAAVVENIFREAHTLKGAARSVGVKPVEQICQALEGVFGAAKKGLISAGDGMRIPMLQTALDVVTDLVRSLPATPPENLPHADPEILGGLKQIAEGNGPSAQAGTEIAIERPPTRPPVASVKPPPQDTPAPTRAVTPETVRIPLSRIEAVWRQSEDLLSVKQTAAQRASEIRKLGANLADWKRSRAKLQPDLRAIQGWLDRQSQSPGQAVPPTTAIRRVLEYLESDRELKHSLATNLGTLARSAANDEHALGNTMDALRDDLQEVLMMPCAYVTDAFPKMVREMARDQGKEVALELSGMELEMDRRVLDEVKITLVHLLRNAIDHGIERPDDRLAAGKPRQGTVRIKVTPLDDRRVEFLVEDDGSGMDIERIRAAAKKAGVVTAEEAARMNEHELRAMALRSGVSTSAMITDISGRGLGMAIVAEKIEQLGGSFALESVSGRGTGLRMIVPLSVAKFSGLLVKLGESLFVLPLTNVDRAIRVKRSAIRMVENRETVSLGDNVLPVVPLDALLRIPGSNTGKTADEYIAIVILSAAGQQLACQVDEVAGTQEVLVKNLGPQLQRVRNISGATTLGTGRVIPILNPADLMKSAENAPGPTPREADDTVAQAVRPKVLVVEDSVTSRTLLRNILDDAGYEVGTAVDGIDAFAQLRGGSFDIVVSDVEMPRMGGFDLTAKIRADHKLADLPVVIVTSLDAAADRERGLEVGANAYLVKSDFEQSNLLEVMRRLVGKTG